MYIFIIYIYLYLFISIYLGGEEPMYPDEGGGDVGGGLANYFTTTLESSFISRRGRPPVIRAAEKVNSSYGNLYVRGWGG